MPYFSSREITLIVVFSALWGILNSFLSPIFFTITNLPILCDLIGFSVLVLTVWWIRRIGAALTVGLLATVINFVFNPKGAHFLGFTAASIAFDLITYLAGYERTFKNRASMVVLMILSSVISAAIAGSIIGAVFMQPAALARWGGAAGWAGLHAIGGIIGGLVGIVIIESLISRGFVPRSG